MNKVLIVILILLSSNLVPRAHAYDWDKCRRFLSKQSKSAGLFGGFATTTTFPIQFSSSWGACSAIGKPEEDRKAFYNDNFERLKINFSENRGEYMKAFVSFYKCSNTGEEAFVKRIRNNFKDIFGKIYNKDVLDLMYPGNRDKNREEWREDWDVTPEASFKKLQDLIGKDDVVVGECKSVR